ncbi:MAG: hypothetical protein P8J45_12535 [Phycisphaerales bacterium]|nr:hypothetical protein [Phycisphaerales bacterium]
MGISEFLFPVAQLSYGTIMSEIDAGIDVLVRGIRDEIRMPCHVDPELAGEVRAFSIEDDIHLLYPIQVVGEL